MPYAVAAGYEDCLLDYTTRTGAKQECSHFEELSCLDATQDRSTRPTQSQLGRLLPRGARPVVSKLTSWTLSMNLVTNPVAVDRAILYGA